MTRVFYIANVINMDNSNENESQYGVNKLISEFGCQPLTDELAQQLCQNNHQLFHMFKCGILAAHRDLDMLLKSNQPFYIYTGRGPSSTSLHFGHVVPFLVTKYLQDIYHIPVFIQLSTDEKYMRDHLTIEQVTSMAKSNAADIMSLGFNPNLTCIMDNMQLIQTMYPTILNIMRHTSINTLLHTFGHQEGDDAGKFFFPIVETAPAFPQSLNGIIPANYRCLVVLGIDQDPYFRIARNIAHCLETPKPVLLHTTFIPGLHGIHTKMSASDPLSAIFLSDTPQSITTKIIKHAFSGGRATLAEHRKLGADITVDVSCRYLAIFGTLVGQDYSTYITDYSTGKLSTREIKQKTIECLIHVISDICSNKISDQDLQIIMTARPLI